VADVHSMNIVQLLGVPEGLRDLAWLKRSLQNAIELELSTIPPYLCGLWSLVTQSGPVYDLIYSIVKEEMLHMGLACNMLTTIGGTPQINTKAAVPQYPGNLPGGVRPQLTVALSGLTKDVILNTFMEIEYPEGGPVTFALGRTYPTIGAFYDAIANAFLKLPTSAFTGARQITSYKLSVAGAVYPIKSQADAQKAILEIKEQGEGTSKTPEAPDFENELAHYYKFAEIYHGRAFVQTNGHWDYTGDPIPFPPVYPMAVVPAGGYPQSQAFDVLFTGLLGNLQNAWANGDQTQMDAAVNAMYTLADPARALMATPLPSGNGNYGPDFRLITGS
jgi:hypothetical protein